MKYVKNEQYYINGVTWSVVQVENRYDFKVLMGGNEVLTTYFYASALELILKQFKVSEV